MKILLPLSDSLKAKLDQKRREGYPINGFIRHVLRRELGNITVPGSQTKGSKRRNR